MIMFLPRSRCRTDLCVQEADQQGRPTLNPPSASDTGLGGYWPQVYNAACQKQPWQMRWRQKPWHDTMRPTGPAFTKSMLVTTTAMGGSHNQSSGQRGA